MPGEIKDPKAFLSSMDLRGLQEKWRAKFNPHAIAPISGMRARPGAERIPFHVMCGTLDTRYTIARDFVASLEKPGYLKTEWPRSLHGPTEPHHLAEWKKSRRRAIEFILGITGRKTRWYFVALGFLGRQTSNYDEHRIPTPANSRLHVWISVAQAATSAREISESPMRRPSRHSCGLPMGRGTHSFPHPWSASRPPEQTKPRDIPVTLH